MLRRLLFSMPRLKLHRANSTMPKLMSGLRSPAWTVGGALAIGGVLGYSIALCKRLEHVETPEHILDPTERLRRAIEEMRSVFPNPEDISTEEDILRGYSRTILEPQSITTHSVIVYPRTTNDVVEIVNISRKYLIPIVPYSSGTSLEGQCAPAPAAPGGAPPPGNICVNLTKMNKIIKIHENDGDIICQAGVTLNQINDTLKDRGIPLFFPLDPSLEASVGGMIGTGCSGTNAVRYGTARGEWFLNITVVLPSGQVIKTRRRARKSSTGFDLTNLFIGAEGTLGIVTEATLRLTPVLNTSVAICHFDAVQSASEASRQILASGAPIQCLELLDDNFFKAVNQTSSPLSQKWKEKNALFIKFQGSDAIINEASRISQQIAERNGGMGWRFAKDKMEAEELWRIRKDALWTGLAYLPNSKALSTDVCVPVSQLPQLIQDTKDDLKRSGITHMIAGHAGDGNFHSLLLYRNADEFNAIESSIHRMVERALSLDGTSSGEHGIGIGKRRYLNEELGLETVELMRSIKKLIDPYNLFNPGKLYPEESR